MAKITAYGEHEVYRKKTPLGYLEYVVTSGARVLCRMTDRKSGWKKKGKFASVERAILYVDGNT
ncbi:MAG: hypothetical protein QXM86_00140 [Candidatus Bathyarchaeia archaeon]